MREKLVLEFWQIDIKNEPSDEDKNKDKHESHEDESIEIKF